MPDCDYCKESFDDEETYLQHLADRHEGQLGAIDRRRVDSRGGSDDEAGLPAAPLVLGVVVIVSVGLLGAVLFLLDSGGSSTDVPGSDGDGPQAEPGPMGSAHEHGTIEVTIAGDQIDFSQGQYQLQADRFHFENGNGEVWHKHATGVTLEWAMATLDIGVTEDSVTYQGTTYADDDPGTEVVVEVNGEPVDPQTYVLEGTEGENSGAGDDVRIIVRTSETE